MTSLDRHRMVYLDPAAWPAILAAHPSAQAIPEVVSWVAAGHPLIARRPLCSDGAGLVPLGLPLPPALGKQRLAFAVPPDAIASTCPAPLLSAAVDAAPAAWRATISALVALDPATRCFGSLAWVHLTGLRYLAETSDLDVFWQVSDAEVAAGIAAALPAIDAGAPMRLDGEFVLPGGAAIQWREWVSVAPELLAKTADGSVMVTRARAFA